MDKKETICYMKLNGVDSSFVIKLMMDGMLNDLDIIICAINNATDDHTIESIVGWMPTVFKNSSQILRLVIEKLNRINYRLIKVFKPMAITKENMRLAMNKGLEIDFVNLSHDMLNDKEIMLHYLKKDAEIYPLLSEEMRSDPDILKLLINNNGFGTSNVLKAALPKAFTKENIMAAIEKDLIPNYKYLSHDMLSDKGIMLQYLRKNVDVYPLLSEEMRSDPDILESVIESKEFGANLMLQYALPNAMTDKNIFLAIKNGVISDADIFTDFGNDKKTILIYIKTMKKIPIPLLSEEMRSDPEILECILENFENPNDIKVDKFMPSAKTRENMEKAAERGIYFSPNLQVITNNDDKTIQEEDHTLSNIKFFNEFPTNDNKHKKT